MSSADRLPVDRDGATAWPDNFGHPRGTLVIVLVFAVLFGLAWFGTYVFLFLERGAPHS